MPVKNYPRTCSLLVSFVFCNLVYGDTITLSTPGASEAFPTLGALNNPNAGQNGQLSFWANHSVDGLTDPTNVNSAPLPYSQLNVGNFLTGTCGQGNALVGSCPQGTFDGVATPNLDPSTLTMYANGVSPVYDFSFTRDGSNALLNPDLVYTANTVQFGWYDVTNPNTLHQIFGGLTENQALPGEWSLTNIPIGTNYGFYAVVNYGTGYTATYYTNSGLNTYGPTQQMFNSLLGADTVSNVPKQHFALFQSGTDYALGLEDGVGTNGYEGMGDYQDAVVSIDSIQISTPEPSTFALTALVIAGAFAARRRLMRRRS
jgi:hypothetical protein